MLFLPLFIAAVCALVYYDQIPLSGLTGSLRAFKCPPSGWYEYILNARAGAASATNSFVCEFRNFVDGTVTYPTTFEESNAKSAILSDRGTASSGPWENGYASGRIQLNATAGCSLTCALDTAGTTRTVVPILILNRVHGSGQDTVALANGVAKKGDGPPGPSKVSAPPKSAPKAAAQATKPAAASGKPRIMRPPPMRASGKPKAPAADLSFRDVLGAVDRLEKVVGPIAAAVAPEYAVPARAAYHAGRKLIDAVMPEHAPHSKNERVVAPVAYGTRIKRGSAAFSRGSTPGALVVSHTEYLTDISGSNGATLISTVDLNPGVFSAFPWLSSIARRFETYRFRRLEYQYKQTTTTGESGVVALASCWNTNDEVPTTKDEIMNFEGTVKSSPWVDLTFNCLHANLKQRQSYFVRTGPVVPPDNDTSRGGVDNRAVDYNMYDTARLITLVEDLTTGVIGELYVRYEIEFMTPIVEFSPDLACTFTRPNDTTTIGCGAMERDPHSTFLVELSQPVAAIDQFDMQQSFEGVVTVAMTQAVGVGSQIIVDNLVDCIIAPESASTTGFVPQAWSQASTLTVPVFATFALKTTGPNASFQLQYTNTAAGGSVLAEPYATAWVTFNSNNTLPFFDPATTSLDVAALKCLIAENKRFRYTTTQLACTMTHDEAMARIRRKPDVSASSTSTSARHLPAF
jgi:hypothetical protein